MYLYSFRPGELCSFPIHVSHMVHPQRVEGSTCPIFFAPSSTRPTCRRGLSARVVPSTTLLVISRSLFVLPAFSPRKNGSHCRLAAVRPRAPRTLLTRSVHELETWCHSSLHLGFRLRRPRRVLVDHIRHPGVDEG